MKEVSSPEQICQVEGAFGILKEDCFCFEILRYKCLFYQEVRDWPKFGGQGISRYHVNKDINSYIHYEGYNGWDDYAGYELEDALLLSNGTGIRTLIYLLESNREPFI